LHSCHTHEVNEWHYFLPVLGVQIDIMKVFDLEKLLARYCLCILRRCLI